MAGPVCEIVLANAATDETLDAVDSFLAGTADHIQRTRKGRVWSVWVHGRPIQVAVDQYSPEIVLSAGCNSPEDYTILGQFGATLANLLGGIASEPTK